MTTILRLGKQQRRQAYIFLLMTAWCFMAGTAAAQTRYYGDTDGTGTDGYGQRLDRRYQA